MQIELTAEDMRLIEEALQSWESEPLNKAAVAMMLKIMMEPKRSEAAVQDMSHKDHAEATEKQRTRQRLSVILRAKLIMAMNKPTDEQRKPE